MGARGRGAQPRQRAALWGIGSDDRHIHILVQGGYAGRRTGCSRLRALLEDENDPAFTRSDGEKQMRAHGMPPLRFSRRQVRDEPLPVITQVAQAIAAAGAWAEVPPPSTPIPAGPEATAR